MDDIAQHFQDFINKLRLAGYSDGIIFSGLIFHGLKYLVELGISEADFETTTKKFFRDLKDKAK